MIARPKTIKPKTCRVCRTEFRPALPMAKVCSPMCALTLARSVNGKAKKVAQVKERKADKIALEKFKSLAKLIAEAQVPFNAFIRGRDADKPCICCGRTTNDDDLLTGSRWDAGHYRSTGSASHLRFNEDNCHRQLAHCNRHGAGRAVDYRIGLIARIGLEAVEALESNNAVHKWNREELIAIKAMYVRRLKELKAREV